MSERLREIVQQLDARIRVLEQVRDPIVRDEFFVVLELVDRLHRAGLAELAVRVRSHEGLWESLLANEEIALLFQLYDLAPLPPEDEAPALSPEDGRRRLPVLKGGT